MKYLYNGVLCILSSIGDIFNLSPCTKNIQFPPIKTFEDDKKAIYGDFCKVGEYIACGIRKVDKECQL